MIFVSPKVSFSYNIRSTLHPRTYFKRWRRGEVSSAGWISSARPPKKKKKEKELWATSGADEDTAPVIGRGVLTRGGGRAARVASCPHEEEHSGSQSQRETRASKSSTPKNSSLSLGRPRKTFLPPSPPLFCSTKWRLRVAIEREATFLLPILRLPMPDSSPLSLPHCDTRVNLALDCALSNENNDPLFAVLLKQFVFSWEV